MFTVYYRDVIFEQTDHETGYDVDPKTGLLVDPDTGLLYNPQSGEYYDPETAQLVDPATGDFLDPETREPIPAPEVSSTPTETQPDMTNAPPVDLSQLQQDPETGLLIDVTSGTYYDPRTMQPVDPSQVPQTAQDIVADQQQQTNLEIIKNVEKYIIYSKLLNLKYSLENSNIPVKDPKEFNDVLYHLTILLSFFDTFDYDQITQIGNFLISRIHSLLNAGNTKK